jgi:NAD(P)-dependent dehydrogenase (short-subunit alcohol dehydrogenase family)
MDINKQHVLISGGASGLGAATAKLLREGGATVTLLDKNIILDKYSFACDVTDELQLQSCLQEIYQRYGSPRVCINCAGIATAKRMVGKNGVMPLSDFQKIIDINLTGTFNVMRLIAAQMSKLDPINADLERGVIINTASISAYEGQIGQSAYSASKGGIVAMTLAVARELAQFGIRVMTIAPGVMDTPMMVQMSDEIKQGLADQVLFPKRLGHANEFAQLVKHIIENVYLNGSVIRLDGGLRMR